jgi:hypothetical protein
MLKAIATYGRVFEKLAGLPLQRYTVEIALKAPGLDDWCNHTYQLARRCIDWSRAVEKYYWPMGSEPLRDRKTLMTICTDRASEARARIAAAIKEICLEGLNVGQRVKAIVAAAHCSPQTLYKNLDLWHPEPERLARPVTPQQAADTPTQADVHRQILESLQSTDIPSVTGLGGENEVCILESAPLKNLPPQGAERGFGGEKGISTAPAPAPALQWPPLDWQPGPAGGCHA